jgi:hypothetical protein
MKGETVTHHALRAEHVVDWALAAARTPWAEATSAVSSPASRPTSC